MRARSIWGPHLFTQARPHRKGTLIIQAQQSHQLSWPARLPKTETSPDLGMFGSAPRRGVGLVSSWALEVPQSLVLGWLE